MNPPAADWSGAHYRFYASKTAGADGELDFHRGLAEEALNSLHEAPRTVGSRKSPLFERNQFDEQNLPELQRSKTDYISINL